MNQVNLNTNLAEIEAMFAVERAIVPESDELCKRAIARARESLPGNAWLWRPSRPISTRRVSPQRVAVGAFMLSALCAAAYYAGYRLRPPETSKAPMHETLGVAPPVQPSTSIVAAVTPPGPRLVDLVNARAKPTNSTNTTTESEAYARELRVLQPARQAVARNDFGAALAAISEHQRRFAAGRLTEEREALRVKTLLGLGRVAEARAVGATFRERFPRSVLLGRIDEMLGNRK